MKPLPTNFTRDGYDYEQLKREDNVAIYRRTKKSVIEFEVFRVQKHDGRIIAGQVIAPAEFMPSSAQWGRLGFTCVTPERAHARFEQLKEAQRRSEASKEVGK